MDENTEPKSEEVSSTRVIAGIIIAFVILGGLTYAAYLYSNRASGSVFPAGYNQAPAGKAPTFANIDCANADPAFKTHPNYYIKCDPYRVSAETKWVTEKDPIHGVTLSVPSDLKTTKYPNGIGFPWRTIQSATNLLISFEPSSVRSGNYKAMIGEDYPKNYWKQFGGLSGLKTITPFTNKLGVTGWQAVFFYGTETPTIDTFFEDPKVPGDFVHFSKGVLADDVYSVVLDSFNWIPKSTPAPTAVPLTSSAPTPAPAGL